MLYLLVINRILSKICGEWWNLVRSVSCANLMKVLTANDWSKSANQTDLYCHNRTHCLITEATK